MFLSYQTADIQIFKLLHSVQISYSILGFRKDILITYQGFMSALCNIQRNARETYFFFQGQGIVKGFYDLSGKMKFCQNVREMSGSFTFQSCKSLDILS